LKIFKNLNVLLIQMDKDELKQLLHNKIKQKQKDRMSEHAQSVLDTKISQKQEEIEKEKKEKEEKEELKRKKKRQKEKEKKKRKKQKNKTEE